MGGGGEGYVLRVGARLYAGFYTCFQHVMNMSKQFSSVVDRLLKKQLTCVDFYNKILS